MNKLQKSVMIIPNRPCVLQWRPVSSNTLKTKKLFAQMTFSVPIPLVTTICPPLSSNTLFAQIFKSTPMVFEVTGLHWTPVSSNSLKTKKLFAQMTFSVPIPLVTNICHPLSSNTLFAQTVK